MSKMCSYLFNKQAYRQGVQAGGTYRQAGSRQEDRWTCKQVIQYTERCKVSVVYMGGLCQYKTDKCICICMHICAEHASCYSSELGKGWVRDHNRSQRKKKGGCNSMCIIMQL